MKLTELTPLELNKFRFSGNHTPLTPNQIEAMRSAPAKADGTLPSVGREILQGAGSGAGSAAAPTGN